MIRRPITILWLFTGLNLLNYLDRFVLAAILPSMQEQLGLSNTLSGLLATVFLLGYFATAPFFGALADRGGRKGLIAMGVVVWSAATFASGLASSALWLLLARVVVGIGEASYATLAPTIIDDVSPADRKSRWLAIFYVAIPVGSALGYLVGGFVEKHWGWRHAFYVAGGPGVVLALLCLFIEEPKRKLSKEKFDALAAVKALWPMKIYRRSVLGYAALTFAMGGFAFWAPKYIVARYGILLSTADYNFGVVTVLAGAVGTLAGGGWADRWLRKLAPAGADEAQTALVNLRVCAWGSALAAPCAVACFLAPTATTFFILAFFCELFIFLPTSPINAAILRSVPNEMRASAMALSIFGIHLLGDLWSPTLIGTLLDFLPRSLAMMVVPAAVAVSALLWWRSVTPDPEAIAQAT